jgi:hypothetical protein
VITASIWTRSVEIRITGRAIAAGVADGCGRGTACPIGDAAGTTLSSLSSSASIVSAGSSLEAGATSGAGAESISSVARREVEAPGREASPLVERAGRPGSGVVRAAGDGRPSDTLAREAARSGAAARTRATG